MAIDFTIFYGYITHAHGFMSEESWRQKAEIMAPYCLWIESDDPTEVTPLTKHGVSLSLSAQSTKQPKQGRGEGGIEDWQL